MTSRRGLARAARRAARAARGWVLALTGALLTVAPAAAQTQGVTLPDALELAYRNHPAVVQAAGQLHVAGAARREAFGNWFPNVTGSTGWSTNSATRFDPTTQRTVTAGSSSYSAGFSASMTLFDGFRRPAQLRAAAADVASADAALVNQQFQVALQTKQAFFTALAADELVRVAETRIERAREQLKISKDKLAAGTAIRSDTLRGSVELANAQLQRLNAETQRATAEATLARLIGVDGPVRALPDSALYAPIELDTAALRAEALERAPAVEQAQAAAVSARAGLAVARAQYLPSITTSYSQSWAGQSLDQLNNTWSLRVGLSWPLFNGFSRETAVARSAASRDAALAQAEYARRQVNEQFTQHLAAMIAAEARLRIAEASHAAAEEDLRVQRERYRLGAATIVDVLTSQVSLDQAAVDIVQARHDYLVARAQLESLVGREL